MVPHLPDVAARLALALALTFAPATAPAPASTLAPAVVPVEAGPAVAGATVAGVAADGDGDGDGDGDWSLPLAGAPEVLRAFDPPPRDWLPGHRGVDLRAGPGDVVRSPAGGVVTFAGTVVDRGVVVVLHDGGLRTSLEPVTADVGVGARVERGAALGRLQEVPGHCAPDTCLHWGVRRGDVYLDPMSLVGEREPIVLLPLR